MNNVPRGRVGRVTLIVFAPFYLWFFPSLFLNKLPPLRLVIVIFWVYLFLGYFVVKAVLKRTGTGKR
jgi:hypothetical protein